ncbi:hypothetical protein DFP74_4594 [Nocardiopsis sp. Huas11]|uniref:hypothetical protein n=1 Tax=Nocardiopsis sp. Huas11 TaxID=2183912 RepID=UPI000EB5053B|nr:hypothetical protein [Nocardiopsis sp. Huas11]RKS08871.1 hypothetical protein DFP74_4594 [Nocardiopsis sp. Huas11]
MRHVVGFLSGLILGPVLLLLGGWVFSHLRRLHGSGLGALDGAGPLALAGLLGVGLVVALLAVPPRLTPMLPLGASLVLGGVTAVSLLRPHLLDRLPVLPGSEGALVLLPLGAYVPLVVVLFATVFVGGRWRREPEGVTEEEYFEGLYGEDDDRRGPASSALSGAPARSGPRHRA